MKFDRQLIQLARSTQDAALIADKLGKPVPVVLQAAKRLGISLDRPSEPR
jgi:hypothetical protein